MDRGLERSPRLLGSCLLPQSLGRGCRQRFRGRLGSAGQCNVPQQRRRIVAAGNELPDVWTKAQRPNITTVPDQGPPRLPSCDLEPTISPVLYDTYRVRPSGDRSVVPVYLCVAPGVGGGSMNDRSHRAAIGSRRFISPLNSCAGRSFSTGMVPADPTSTMRPSDANVADRKQPLPSARRRIRLNVARSQTSATPSAAYPNRSPR